MLGLRFTCALILVCCLGGCGGSGPPKSGEKEPPAKVEKHESESDINQLTLTADAVERLGIKTEPVKRESVQRHRTFGGEVVVPTGSAIIVSAPLLGTLGLPGKGTIPAPGSRVQAGDSIFSFVPLLSPERDVLTPAQRASIVNAHASLKSSQMIAAGDAKQAKAEVDAATIALTRAEKLLRDKAGSERNVDDAQATLNLANKKLEAAAARKTALEALNLDAEQGRVRSGDTLQITAPKQGILQNLSVTRGQTVTAGTPLFEVVNLDTVWIRVPVYVGLLDQIETKDEAEIGDLKGGSNRQTRNASPIAAPPSADPQSATVDLYYKISNPDGALHPGERVGVTLSLKGEAESLVVPWAAVLYDIHGTTWVYEKKKTADHVFLRRRVLVRYTVGDIAVLASGPKVGTEVVVAGAAELFGTEFGAGK